MTSPYFPAENGIFVVSLDFELMWGMLDVPFSENYKRNILGARKAIPKILKLFETYGIHATWAVVGLLFFDNREELRRELPSRKPNYVDSSLSPYTHIPSIGKGEADDGFHFGLSLIRQIDRCPGQEIASHSFSHYLCLEKGSDLSSFREDMKTALNIAKKKGFEIESFVFPKYQVNPDFFSVLKDLGIKTYRGNADDRIHAPAPGREYFRLRRKIVRFLDAYINILGCHT